MKIYRYWVREKRLLYGREVDFKAGSDESPEKAREILEQKVSLYRRVVETGEKPARRGPTGAGGYEAPICEEICETLDPRNIVTRNRYGALVLNSEELLFLDIDTVTPTFREMMLGLLGRMPPVKERILARVGSLAASPEYADLGFRVYETARGVRVMLSLDAREALLSGRFSAICRRFKADPLYEMLCIRQGCCRARLTPKPARIAMKTLVRFRYPGDEEQRRAVEAWVLEYERKSAAYAVCRLRAEYGRMIHSSAQMYHDRMTRADRDLPLA